MARGSAKASAACSRRCAWRGWQNPATSRRPAAPRWCCQPSPVDRDLGAQLSPEARALVRALRDAGRLSTGELVRVSRRSRPIVLRDLEILRDAGVVDWVGKSKKDPRAYWRLPADVRVHGSRMRLRPAWPRLPFRCRTPSSTSAVGSWAGATTSLFRRDARSRRGDVTTHGADGHPSQATRRRTGRGQARDG